MLVRVNVGARARDRFDVGVGIGIGLGLNTRAHNVLSPHARVIMPPVTISVTVSVPVTESTHKRIEACVEDGR